jgi:hypothetical protein
VSAALASEGDARANERHKWSALFITTLGMLMATIDASIVLIALPDIFRGIHLAAGWATSTAGCACTTSASRFSRSSRFC